MAAVNLAEPFTSAEQATERAYKQERFDDFAAVPVKSGEELRRHFAERFFFGCEADDPMTAWAFDKHGHHRLNPIFSSDVGHFDVLDMSEVLEEAWELVEHGHDLGGRLQGVRLRQPGAAAHRAQPRLLQGHGGGRRGGEAHSIVKWASVVAPVRPLMGRMSWGQAEKATIRSISARKRA